MENEQRTRQELAAQVQHLGLALLHVNDGELRQRLRQLYRIYRETLRPFRVLRARWAEARTTHIAQRRGQSPERYRNAA